MQKVILGIILLVIIAGAVALFMMKKDTGAPTGDMQGDVRTEENTRPHTEVVFGETFSGSVVNIARAFLEQPGYVAIYRTTSEGEAYVSGYSDLLDSGAQTNVAVVLPEQVVKGDLLAAAIHTDDGDSVFEFPGDDNVAEGIGELATDMEIVDEPLTVRDEVFMARVMAFLRGQIGVPDIAGVSAEEPVEE